jgi:hypothetical protein
MARKAEALKGFYEGGIGRRIQNGGPICPYASKIETKKEW